MIQGDDSEVLHGLGIAMLKRCLFEVWVDLSWALWISSVLGWRLGVVAHVEICIA